MGHGEMVLLWPIRAISPRSLGRPAGGI